MQRIIFINRFYYPDHSATSQLLTQLSEFLAKSDKNIHIITSRQMYEDPKVGLNAEDLINNVTIHRVYSSTFGRDNLMGRTIDYLTFYISSFVLLLALVRKNDVLIAKTDPPLISVVAAVVAKIKSGILVNWIQDLFPEVAREISPGSIPVWLYKFIQTIRNWSIRVARKNIVIGNIMRDKVIAIGVKENSVKVIQNWFIDEEKKIDQNDIRQLKHQWGLDDKFIVGYSGNLGRAHNYETFLESASMLSNNKDIVFLFVGGGVGMELMKTQAKERALNNIVFKPYQPLSNLLLTLSVSNVHLISLLPRMEGLIVPSKLYGVLAANRPMLFVGSQDGEISELIKSYDCGSYMECGESEQLANYIMQYRNLDVDNESMYIRQIYNNNFRFDLVTSKWLELLDGEL